MAGADRTRTFDASAPAPPDIPRCLRTAASTGDLSNKRKSGAKRLTLGLELFQRTLEKQKRQREEKGVIHEQQRRRKSHNLALRETHGGLADCPPIHPDFDFEPWHRVRPDEVSSRSQRRRTTAIMPSARRVGGGVRLSGGPVLTDNETSTFESDISSVVDISDHLAASEDDTEDEYRDTNKYRMPECGKTRLGLHTKEPLSPTPRVGVRREGSGTPTMSGRGGLVNGGPPPSMDFSSQPWQSTVSVAGAENDTAGDGDSIRTTVTRPGSVYTLGRASFTGQLAQLTSMRLPDATSLAKRISSMATSTEAAQALADASEQIRMWIRQAENVLNGLNAEDDVEWAAAGGREGIQDVDGAIGRFEQLVEVYVLSIERLQTRPDVCLLSKEEIRASGVNLETIIGNWQGIKDTLKSIKFQVEVAMEWEELWNTVLGEISQEMNGLNQLVFEMEEKRHQGAESLLSSRDSIDLSELETIVEDAPGRAKANANANNRFSVVMPFSSTGVPLHAPPPLASGEQKEDSSLLALFARMQPLRAALDFLPMRLAAWHRRGNDTFPSACLDLDQRQTELEIQWTKLEADAESLRRELGEDRWVLVFRNAGRQAMKMCESIMRSVEKVKESVSKVEQVGDKVENYEAKKRHYGPAIERVIAIIDRGVKDRLTVNGEILRLQSDIKKRWARLQTEILEMDGLVEELARRKEEEEGMHLRDSVSSSTVISEQRSVGSGSRGEGITPATSPASSVIVTNGGSGRKSSFGAKTTPTHLSSGNLRSSTGGGGRASSRLSPGGNGGGTAHSTVPRRSLLPRKSNADFHSTPSRTTSSPGVGTAGTAGSSASPGRPAVNWPSRGEVTPQPGKGRFVNAVKSEVKDFRPLSAFEPSPYAKGPITPKRFQRATAVEGGQGQNAKTPGLRHVSAPTGAGSSIPAPVTSSARKVSGGSAGLSKNGAATPGARARATSASHATSTKTGHLGPSSRLANSTSSTNPAATNGANGHLTSSTNTNTLKSTRSLAFLVPRPGSRAGSRAASRLADSGIGDEGGSSVDGNEADNESPTHWKERPGSSSRANGGRPGSRGVGGRRSSLLGGRSSAMGGRARSRLDGLVGGEGGDDGGLRPKWRP
ncbi:unnamed protein product [Zymoseptoria tritici ST99CH_1A5]|uniref:Karyogamy protein n=2 Tax=Zymoseptoria tritici TaxID=1047171 RepID=A0A2H1GJC5_ZYMTR|nr:unnamed protein product [Zymoseptoria tritici ST99CH_1E4]SMY25211.1 unnamed protein product [Zymoseptoria tritici ST99CH_1A5]